MKNELTLQKDNDRRISAGAAAALFAINQTICFPPVNMNRSQVGAVVVSKGLAAYVGGNHVAIHNKNSRGEIVWARLAIVTGNFGDWLPSGTQPQPDKTTAVKLPAWANIALDNTLPKLTIAKERGHNGTFKLEGDSNIEGVKADFALVPYKPHAEQFILAVNERAALCAVAEAVDAGDFPAIGKAMAQLNAVRGWK